KAGGLRRMAVTLLARTSHAVLAADEQDLVALGGPAGRYHQVPIGANVVRDPGPGYDRTGFRAQLGLGADDLLVVYFGLLNASKGLDTLLDAFDLIVARNSRAHLLLLGGEVGASDPTDRLTADRLRDRLDRPGQRVLRTGWLSPPALSAHLLAGDVALLPYA